MLLTLARLTIESVFFYLARLIQLPGNFRIAYNARYFACFVKYKARNQPPNNLSANNKYVGVFCGNLSAQMEHVEMQRILCREKVQFGTLLIYTRDTDRLSSKSGISLLLAISSLGRNSCQTQ